MTLHLVPTTEVDDWTRKITAAWQKQVSAIFEVGRLLVEAKAALPHGAFIPMIESELPFSRRTAHRLMAIADDPRLSNVTHGSHLPPSWRTLYELTKLPDDVFEKRIVDGSINPDMERSDVNYRSVTDGENEWYTPQRFIDLAVAVMGGIDLDPASNPEANKVVGAKRFFTRSDDGVAQKWWGRVWLNPPYSRDLMPAFTDKLGASVTAGDVEQAIMVSHNNTDTGWFQRLAPVSAAICFPAARIRFYRGEDVAAPINGQMFMYFGRDVAAFKAKFAEVGCVYVPA